MASGMIQGQPRKVPDMSSADATSATSLYPLAPADFLRMSRLAVLRDQVAAIGTQAS
jgi:hypothetical protein